MNGQPGFNRQIIDTLKDKHEKDPWQYTLCSVMVDGMAIKSHLQWDPHTQRMMGFTDLGLASRDGGHDDSDEVATEALVILVVGLVGHWKAPIAYFLTSKLSSAVQGELLRQVIVEIQSVGLIVVALVMDGLSGNVRMAKDFGCSLDPSNIAPLFPNPTDPTKQIAVIFDACHMLKLLRNTLHAYKAILIPSKGVARFQHFRLLQITQEDEGLRAGNRLTARHVEFQRQKMKVKLAAQLFSSSVAKGLNLARTLGLQGFADSEGTEHLCMVIDRLFDIFNTKSRRGRGFKGPLTVERMMYHQEFLRQTEEMLRGMTTDDGKVKICESRRSMGVIGFISNIHSLAHLTRTILGSTFGGKPVIYILTYKLSQDHLEILFACIRKAGGFNNNPNAGQFVATYKKLMFRSGVSLTPNDNGNINAQDDTSLVVASRYMSRKDTEEFEVSEEQCIMFEDALIDHSYSTAVMQLSPFIDNVLVYIAGFVVRSVTKRLRCVDCVDALTCEAVVGQTALLLTLKNNGGLLHASNDVIRIIHTAENVLRSSVNCSHPGSSHKADSFGLKLEMKVLSKLPKNLFESKEQHFNDTSHGCDGHYLALIRLICKCFLNVRRHHIAHMANIARQKDVVRQSNNKLTLFKNQ